LRASTEGASADALGVAAGDFGDAVPEDPKSCAPALMIAAPS
jgi:hypothetical protein